MDKTESDNFVTIRALLPTVPLPSNGARPVLITDRLCIRPLEPNDLEAIHALRTQAEVMKWTTSGRVDQNIEESREKLSLFLPPNDATTANCAICLKDTGELIGLGGCHVYSGTHGWPEVGYMLRKEFWGRGIATEFLGVWLQFWEQLPRSEREVRVQREMVVGDGRVEEQLIAITEADNVKSQNVLLKLGFERFWDFTEEDDSTLEEVQLVAFRYFPSSNRRIAET